MFAALHAVHASDDQRLAVMAAWDEYDEARKTLEAKFHERLVAVLSKDPMSDWERWQAQGPEEGREGPLGGRRGGPGGR